MPSLTTRSEFWEPRWDKKLVLGARHASSFQSFSVYDGASRRDVTSNETDGVRFGLQSLGNEV